MSESADGRSRREALGVGLAALGLLVALAVVPASFGETASPEANLVGPAGAALHEWLAFAFGAAAFLVVVPALVWSLFCFGGVRRRSALRWTLLVLAALALVPAGLWLAAGSGGSGGEAQAGWTGRTVGAALMEMFGPAGALIITISVLAALSVLTLGWSPARGLSRLYAWTGRGAGAIPGFLRTVGRTGAEVLSTIRERWAGEPTSPWEGGGFRSGSGRATPGPDAEESDAGAPVAAGARGRGGVPSGGGARGEKFALEDPGDLSHTELPPVDLLTRPDGSSRGLGERELKQLGNVLIRKLASFRVEGRIRGWTTGPVVTQFEVVPAPGVKVGQITARADDLALALRAPSVRMVAPIPGKGAVGVEVPNPEPEVVHLREMLESRAYRGARMALPLALGRDLSGDPYCTDLSRMPHLLIAGATGSGKSVCINTIITSLLYRYTPRQLRLLMIDPKMVELSVYDDLPHLRHPVVTDNREAASILKWTVYEMNRRYDLLSANGCRSLREFNRRVREGEAVRASGASEEDYGDGELPYIALFIDELADLMMTVQAEVEGPLAMLAQKARAVGIHLVIATQRPSVNVITGLIKANFPSRIAFRVASKTDSRTILDQNGAESLLGNGDMLFLPPGEADPVRIQGAFIGGGDTARLVSWYGARARAEEEREAGESDILAVVRELEEEEARVDVVEEVLEERDELFRQAAEVVVVNDSGSTSLLQRRLKIGYGRAARIIDQLHHAGVVGPSEGSRPREVLVGTESLDEVLAETDGGTGSLKDG